MEKKITCYSPNIVNNLYAINVRRLLNEKGYKTLSLKDVLKNPELYYKCQIFNFNWFENVSNWKQYYAKSFLLWMLHSTGKCIIYTLHNKKPHDHGANQWSLKMMKKLCRISDRIVGLCPDTRDVVDSILPGASEKLEIIPHPNYISNYENVQSSTLRDKYNFLEDDLVFLFIGFVSPYKNLELLINTFKKIKNPRIKLLIAGKPCDSKYQRELENKIGNSKNIRADFRYIPDDEMLSFYNTSNIIVLPYHKTSSLNSGAVYLTFSLGRTVICPDIGTINALGDKSFVYEYHYDDEEEHSKILREKILEVCADFEKNPNIIIEKGKAAYRYMAQENSDIMIADKYDQLYRSLIEGR